MDGVRANGVRIVAALVVVLAIGFAGGDDKVWEVTWLDMDGDWLAAGANDLNSSGLAGGTFADADYVFFPVYWDEDGWHDLNPPDGWDGAGGNVYRVNEKGVMAGYVADEYGYVAPVLWDTVQGTAVDLNPYELDDEYYGAQLSGLNERGDAVGYLVWAKETWPYYGIEAYFWSKNGKSDGELPMLEGFDCDESNARSVNSSGDAVGKCFRRWDVQRAVLWPADGGVVDLHAKLVDAFPDIDVSYTEAVDISESGRVVGYIWSGDYAEGWAWSWHEKGGAEILDRDEKAHAFPWAAKGPYTGGSIGDYFVEDVQACIWKKGDLDAIPLPDGYWYMESSGMNRHGQVSGFAAADDDPDLAYPLAFVAKKVPDGD